MTNRRVLAWVLLIIGGWGLVVTAQQQPQEPPQRPDPPPQGSEQFFKRMYGAPPTFPPTPQQDPAEMTEEEREAVERFRNGLLPPGSSFSDFLEILLKVKAYPKERVYKIDDHYAYPHPAISIKMEIVKEDEDTIWLRGISPENPESPFHRMWNSWQVAELLTQDRRKNPRPEYFVDFDAPIVPPPFVDALSFEQVTSGLPDSGRWQMNFTLADMNEDGLVDIVCPPTRKGTPQPSIFLGEGDGKFRYWAKTQWPASVPWDYGGIATPDLDGDGHLDLVIAIHFKAQYVMYGDGAGTFSRPYRFRSPDPRISSRAVAAADFDHDGRTDLAFLAEINYDQAQSTRLMQASMVWLQMNRSDGWELVEDVIMKGKLIGDNIKAPDVDGDTWPDLLLSSNTSNWRSLVYLNRGKEGFKRVGFKGVLSGAYHNDVAIGPKLGGVRQIFSTFLQYRRIHGHNQARNGVIMYPWKGVNGLETPGAPLVVRANRINAYERLAVGDLNNDGLTDVVASRYDGAVVPFIQTSPGFFYEEQAPELVAPGRPFDIHLIDLNNDKLDDIVVASVSSDERPGGIYVWITRKDT